MMRQTGCDGVIVGRGCLGRPWLFRELAQVFRGEEPAAPPRLGEVATIALRHAELLAAFFGAATAVLHMRKLAAWYTKSFPGAARSRAALNRLASLAELRALLLALDPDEPFPPAGLRVRRGKAAGTQRLVHLPAGYLDHLDDDALPAACDADAQDADGG
jgi:hypothetical protein